jgi:2-polyprenyl-6-methoxyphenol hydroxylase-like FAD-dependent oxidoreductase
MRVLIIGAGIAGSVAGLALRKAGLEPTIFEAYDEPADAAPGVYLTVAVNGLDALRAVDVDHLVTTAGFACPTITFVSGSGGRLGSVAMGPARCDGTVAHAVRRTDLHDGLHRTAAERGVPIVHGKRLVDARPRAGGGVLARFSDGSTAKGDVLIGADGVHSRTRGLISGANPEPRYTGLGNTGGFTGVCLDDLHLGAAPGDYVTIWGSRCTFCYTVSPRGEIWWFANPPSAEAIPRATLRSMTTEDLRDHLLGLLARDRTPAADIVRATEGVFHLSNQYAMPVVPTWHNEAMVIIGDAAHAVPPVTGQGCSLATEDAVELARCLRDLPDVPAALAAYERLRRERLDRVVGWAAGLAPARRRGPVLRGVRRLVLPLLLARAARPSQRARLSWLFDHHIDWAAPVPTEPVSVPSA